MPSAPEPETAPPDLVALILAATPAARSCCDAGAEPSLAPSTGADLELPTPPAASDA
jgi:hypothetical protein